MQRMWITAARTIGIATPPKQDASNETEVIVNRLGNRSFRLRRGTVSKDVERFGVVLTGRPIMPSIRAP
jgi:hypothetical protein